MKYIFAVILTIVHSKLTINTFRDRICRKTQKNFKKLNSRGLSKIFKGELLFLLRALAFYF